MNPNGRAFGAKELAKLKHLIATGWKDRPIAAILGRHPSVITEKRISLKRQSPDFVPEKPKDPVPDSVLEDRARRLEASHRDLTGFVFGDPVVGQSMLDRRPA